MQIFVNIKKFKKIIYKETLKNFDFEKYYKLIRETQGLAAVNKEENAHAGPIKY